jgi:pSer/pThr/pTyr-binding forkhead associated (FHA) protein
MPESLLTILKYCLLALLYLFFARVLRAVWAELRTPVAPVASPSAAAPARARTTPAAAPAKGRRGGGPPVLTVAEPAEQKGRTFPIGEEVTIGRAAGCGIALADDTFVSQLHARLFVRDGALFVEDLGSTNGTYVNRKRVGAPVAVGRGDRIQVGRTVLEVGR